MTEISQNPVSPNVSAGPQSEGQALLQRLISARRAEGRVNDSAFQGVFPLAPTQLYMLNRDDVVGRNHINLSDLYICAPTLHAVHVREAVERLCDRHAVLRTRFQENNGIWRQSIEGGSDSRAFVSIQLEDVSEFELQAHVEAVAAELQLSLHLIEGPLMRIAHFDLGSKRAGRLLIVIHHAIIDGYSLSSVTGEFFTLLRDLHQGRPAAATTTAASQFPTWCEALEDYVEAELERDASSWLEQPWHKAVPLPIGSSAPLRDAGEICYLKCALGSDETRRLIGRAGECGAHLVDLITTATALTVSAWTGSRVVSLAQWDHGRRPFGPVTDLSREVGCFAHYWPFTMDLDKVGDKDGLVRLAHARRTASRPPHIGFKLGRFSGRDDTLSRQFKTIPIPEIHVNYLGHYWSGEQIDPVLGPAPESPGPLRNPRNWNRFRVVSVNAYVRDGALRFNWSYSNAVYKAEEFELPFRNFVQTLREFDPLHSSTTAQTVTPN